MLSKFICDVKVFIYSINGKPKKLNPDLITSIEITKDFFKNTVNRMEVTAMFTREDIIAIIENYQNTTITLDIVEIEMLDGRIKSQTSFIKKTFEVIPAELSTDRYKQIEETSDKGEKAAELMPFIFHLYNKADVNIMKQNINLQLMTATAADALYALCHLRSISGGITIAQKPVNNKTHSSLVLNTADFSGNLKELNEKYGLYNGSPFEYKDYDFYYILDKYTCDPKLSIPSESTLITIHVKDPKGNAAKESGYIIDSKKLNDNMNFVGLPSISNIKNELAHIRDNNIIHVDPSIGSKSSKKIDNLGGSKARVIVSNNPNIVSKEIAKLDSLSRTISLSFDNVPPSKFKPYKVFNFKKDPAFKDIDLSGNFKMSFATIKLLRGSDSTMMPIITFNLIST